MSIQSVQRAVAILRCLSGSRRLGVSELSEQLELAKGTIHGLLRTLRDEGFVEQDADTVMLLHRPGKFDGTQEDNVLEIIIGKQRNGPVGTVKLTFLKPLTKFDNLAPGSSGGGEY